MSGSYPILKVGVYHSTPLTNTLTLVGSGRGVTIGNVFCNGPGHSLANFPPCSCCGPKLPLAPLQFYGINSQGKGKLRLRAEKYRVKHVLSVRPRVRRARGGNPVVKIGTPYVRTVALHGQVLDAIPKLIMSFEMAKIVGRLCYSSVCGTRFSITE